MLCVSVDRIKRLTRQEASDTTDFFDRKLHGF
jgi:hypothetical protein